MRRARWCLIVLVSVGLAAAGAPAASAAPPGQSADAAASGVRLLGIDLERATVLDLQRAMDRHRLGSVQLTAFYLLRIRALNPRLHAVIETNPDALSEAAASDRRRQATGARGPLDGIPVLLKDNVDTADREHSTAGSFALVDSRPARDAFLVRRLRAAGAVILGKANLSEWANFRSFTSSSGWSGRGGQANNPYVLDRNPCGSSSGSGVAAAANLASVTIGTETDGSIVCPAGPNSAAGIKPTPGPGSRAGIIPISHSQDTAGPMCRTVTDAAILLGALTGIDSRDDATKASSGKSLADYTKSLDPNGLKGARIGVHRKGFGFNDAVDKLMNDCIDIIKRRGATVIDPADIPTAGKFDDSELEVLLYEFKADLNSYLTSLGPRAPVKSLKEIIDFNEQYRDREMPWFGQDIMTKAQAKGPLTEKAYREALLKNQRMSRKEGIDFVMDKNKLDALIAPTGGPAWPTDWINGDHFTGGYSLASAGGGYPPITVPAGYVFWLSVGISFFGAALGGTKLIKVAYAFEQTTKTRPPPRFLEKA